MLTSFNQLWARYNIKPNGVLHLGANTGQEAETYAKLGVRKVIWVEALLDVCTQLASNVAKYPENIALLACLSDKDGDKVTFRRANNGSQSSSFLEFGTHAKEYPDTKFVEEIPMTTTRCDTLLNKNRIVMGVHWFLNVDLQGAELLALKGMEHLLWCFDWAYVEVNVEELYKGCPRVGEIDGYLAKYGLREKQRWMTPAGWGDCLFYRER